MDGNKKTAARLESVRAFAIARGTVIVFALDTAADYVLDRYHLCSSQTKASFILPCVRVTAAAAAEWRALWLAMVCCAVLEAALALTVVRHYMYARAVCILLAADPGYHLTLICIGSISTFFARDVTSFMFMDLLHGGKE
ncbi:hypothetical protein VPH35_106200 [Triticum aestivum]